MQVETEILLSFDNESKNVKYLVNEKWVGVGGVQVRLKEFLLDAGELKL